MRAMRFAAMIVLGAACGGSPPPSETPAGAPARDGSGAGGPEGSGTREDPVQLCHMNGGRDRTDYPYVASYRCPDGSTPLGGDPARGQAARVGNVGEGSDGHVLDVYEIQCPSGTVQVYVDAYHCAPGVIEDVDPQNLAHEQLRRFALMIRDLHGDPSSQRAFALRRELMAWLLSTRQITIVMCDFSAFLPAGGGRPWLAELSLSLAAGVIEDGREQADAAGVIASALSGLLVYYEAVLAQEGEGAREPTMDALAELDREGKLGQRAGEIAAACGDTSSMGVHFVR